MLDRFEIGVHSYDFYESYLNHIVFNLLEKHELPHLSRGDFVLSNKVNVTSEEFAKEVNTWFQTQKFEIITTCLERFARPAYTLITRIKSEAGSFRALGHFVFHNDNLAFDIYAKKENDAIELFNLLETRFKSELKSVGGNIKFGFWQFDPEEGSDVSISVKHCPSLAEISNNYSPKLLKQIQDVFSLEDPYQQGKIILYHGSAGNGKTHLIRALAREWNERRGIIPEVIIDPEQLYEIPKYLTSLLLNGTNQVYSSKVTPPFRLIIAEDCAQLFSTDCRNQTGFSRLLNTVDGILGQGQKLIFVFTANEQISEIDPAVLRPGRCLQNLEVPNWTRTAAKQWLEAKNVNLTDCQLPAEISLAEMYAMANKTMHAEQNHRSLGF